MSGPSVVEDLFLDALGKNTPEERAAFLNVACKDDSDLRRRVERLLEAHPKVSGFLAAPARPAGEETAAYIPTREQVGTVIAGRYKLLEQIGEGGMGTVWVAEQTQPIRRKVALKLIKAGMDSKTVLSRFEAERQALALMDHPNIAKVLDGGATEGGRPYFVMEYVKGVPLTGYCDDARLSVAQRLALFVPVCQAVQHAHQKGIIHRDLKPSNILVCLYDGKPVPKVIDFGLAKAMHQPLTEHTLHTAHGVMMGTPLYMSPEQAEFNNLDVDTRTDIYALGVILYELLTGTTPLEKQRFKEAAWQEMLRLIKEEEPQRPSVRLSGSRTLPSLAAQRQLEPVKLTQLVRGELDWIVMKCLEKERGRRYDTATGLARDVERYLADEMVEARPPTAWYRLRKFARKNRVMLATVAAFAALLIVAAAVSSWLTVKAHRAEEAAKANAKEARANAKEAEDNLEWSEANARALGETYRELEKVNITNLVHILGLQVDLDLGEARTDPRISLLRLAHPLKDTWDFKLYGPNSIGEAHAKIDSDYPPLHELRQFVAAAVIAAGQEYAPLLPPITHDGQLVVFVSLSPDNQTLLTLGQDYTARLWDVRTARQIAILRKGDERVVNCGFSPDGRTVFTDDLTSVARIWDAPSGRFRAATEARPNRYAGSEEIIFNTNRPLNATQISDGRLLTKSWTPDDSVVELWDKASGRLIARLDGPNRPHQQFKFLGGGRWVAALEGSSTVLMFSPEDGRVVGRLKHPARETVNGVDASPTGRRIATVSAGPKGEPGTLVRMWDAGTWKADAAPMPINAIGSWIGRGSDYQFWTEDLFAFSGEVDPNGTMWDVYRYGRPEPLAVGIVSFRLLPPAGDLVRFHDGMVHDSLTWQRLLPPAGRKFPTALARFAQDGRFVVTYPGGLVIDTVTDKVFGKQLDEGWMNWPSRPGTTPYGNVPGFGLVAARYEQVNYGQGGAVKVRLIPPPSRLDLPADLLELWAQVVVRGELDGEGRFVKWDESKWEKKRQELAAKPVPYPDFPFPGHVATDKLHWLRQEYESARDDSLARQLLDRAEAAGDKDEAIRWRAILTPTAPTKPQGKP
jgi:eukaryotic-like serine/threonine-protein kinase